MTTDEELEEFIKNADDKVITQEDKVDESVGEQLGQMGWIWDETIKKLDKDKTCFHCKETIKIEVDPIRVSLVGNSDLGTAIFVSLCGKCHDTLLKEQDKLKGEKDGDSTGESGEVDSRSS